MSETGITNSQVRQLKDEAARTGDMSVFAKCQRVLDEDDDDARSDLERLVAERASE